MQREQKRSRTQDGWGGDGAAAFSVRCSKSSSCSVSEALSRTINSEARDDIMESLAASAGSRRVVPAATSAQTLNQYGSGWDGSLRTKGELMHLDKK